MAVKKRCNGLCHFCHKTGWECPNNQPEGVSMSTLLALVAVMAHLEETGELPGPLKLPDGWDDHYYDDVSDVGVLEGVPDDVLDHDWSGFSSDPSVW